MHWLMLHCFGFVFPTLGNYMYMYNRYKIENKLSLSRIESRIEIRETENKRFTQDWFVNNFTQTYSCNITMASDISRKKSKISRDFRGQIRGKIGWFRGIFAGKKSKFAAQSADFGGFRGREVKIHRKIGPFRGILAEKSQFSKDFQGQILRKIGRFHGKFRGETSPRNNQ